MKAGAENRKKTIAAGVLGSIALICLYFIYDAFFGGTTTPPPSITTNTATGTAAAPPNAASEGSSPSNTTRTQQGSGAAAAGVNAQRLAKVSVQFDPTLDEAAMLRTESLVYSGSGRNIFSATYEAPVAAVAAFKPPKNVPSPRTNAAPPPPAYMGPPARPPIPLRFFGTVQRADGSKRVFLLSGEDVYLAAPGEIVARKFKIGRVETNGVMVTDLTDNNVQIVPLQTH